MEIRFKLNPKNEKDKVIIDVLSGEYSPSETIKNILYKMGMEGGESQQMPFSGVCSEFIVFKESDVNPINGDEGSDTNDKRVDDKRQVMEQEEHDDIKMYFS